MFTCGLVSVSFRENTVDEIISAAKKAGLKAIEWGSDIHVPAGDIEKAKYVKSACDKAGIMIESYGAYYKLCQGKEEEFKAYVDTAKALGAKTIRIWAGEKSSELFTKDEWESAVKEAKYISDIAKSENIVVATEYHPNTITDNYDSAQKFFEEVNCENFKTYWQPNQFKSDEYNLKSIDVLLKYIQNVHVFHWNKNEKLPLREGTDIWKKYLDLLKKSGYDHILLLEFMHDGKIETLEPTAKTLHDWVK